MSNITAENATTISRREFLGTAGGLALGFTILPDRLLQIFDARAATGGVAANAWVHIGTDGTVSIMLPSSEMGQGIMTSLPILLAEELDADWSKVKVVQAHVDAVFNNPVHFNVQGIGGSRSIRGYWPIMRPAGAQARYVLMANAAERWSVPVSECSTEPNRVLHKASGRAMGYGEIAAFAKVPADVPKFTEKELKAIPAADARLTIANFQRTGLSAVSEPVDVQAWVERDDSVIGVRHPQRTRFVDDVAPGQPGGCVSDTGTLSTLAHAQSVIPAVGHDALSGHWSSSSARGPGPLSNPVRSQIGRAHV